MEGVTMDFLKILWVASKYMPRQSCEIDREPPKSKLDALGEQFGYSLFVTVWMSVVVAAPIALICRFYFEYTWLLSTTIGVIPVFLYNCYIFTIFEALCYFIVYTAVALCVYYK